jgi:hypothetical protein
MRARQQRPVGRPKQISRPALDRRGATASPTLAGEADPSWEEPAEQAASPPDRLRAGQVLALQRVHGNNQTTRLLGARTGSPAAPLVQRSNPADTRLPADQPEALQIATEEDAALTAAQASLAASPDPTKQNVPALIADQNLVVHPLTPRHDSAVSAPTIHFFPGHSNYTSSLTLPADVTHRISSSRRGVWVRARDHGNVDTALGAAEVEQRLVQAVSEVAHTKAARPGTPNTFDLYQARFNGFFDAPTFAGLSTAFDPSLDSRGPRTQRARRAFERVLEEEPAIRTAYETDAGGVRERIDSYVGPEGMNRVDSPRLQDLREAFFPFPVPVPDARFPELRAAVAGPAAALDAADRTAIAQSNAWQDLVNRHVLNPDNRRDLAALIAGGSATAPPGALAAFVAAWEAPVTFLKTASDKAPLAEIPELRYQNGRQIVGTKAQLPTPQTNPGLTLFVRHQVLRGGGAVAPPTVVPFPPGASTSERVNTAFLAPATVPAAGDPVEVVVELLDGSRSTVHDTKRVSATIKSEVVYSQSDAERLNAEDETHLNDASPGAFLDRLRARGGIAANVVEVILAGRIPLRALGVRHDSAAQVATAEGAPNPARTAYFAGPTYTDTFVSVAGAAAFFSPRFNAMLMNRTLDVPSAARRDDAFLMDALVHESVHALDVRPNRGTPIERYKTEFRAYWMMGDHGPPDGTCPSPPGDCKSTVFDPSLPAPGPKSPRARAIFQHVYGSTAYPFVKPNYDDNVDGFRDAVDSYLIPDGINLIASIRLDALREHIENWNGTGFATFRADVQGFLGVGPVVTPHVLNAEDRQEVVRNRAWRDLVERKVRPAVQQRTIKTDLGIP